MIWITLPQGGQERLLSPRRSAMIFGISGIRLAHQGGQNIIIIMLLVVGFALPSGGVMAIFRVTDVTSEVVPATLVVCE